MVTKQAAVFEGESRRMNIEAERIALEKTHVERDSAHLEARGQCMYIYTYRVE